MALVSTLTSIPVLVLAFSSCGKVEEETQQASEEESTQMVATDLGRSSEEELEQRQIQSEAISGSETSVDPTTPADPDRFDPNALLRAMAIPVVLESPDRAEISAIGLHIWRDETRREVYDLTIEVTSDEASQDLSDALLDQPVLPLRGIHIPLPTFDYFYDWYDPSITVEPEGSGSRATISTSARRQHQGAGDEITPGETAALLRQAAYDRALRMGPAGSSLRWTAADPNVVQASLSLAGLDQDRTEVIDWIRTHALPGTFQSTFVASDRDDRIDGNIEAELGGQPPAGAVWRGGSYRDYLTLTFSYSIDDDGLPLPDQAVVVAPDLPVLISLGSQWRVDSDGVADDGWTNTGFDDAHWRTASAPFVRSESVRGAAPIATPASGDPAWFRHSFSLEDPAAIGALEVSFMADDGAVVYLNGVEIHRWNLPPGPVDSQTTLAVTRISGEDEEVLHVAGNLPASELRAGDNVLAIAILQASADSSDARFDAQLVGWPTGS